MLTSYVVAKDEADAVRSAERGSFCSRSTAEDAVKGYAIIGVEMRIYVVRHGYVPVESVELLATEAR